MQFLAGTHLVCEDATAPYTCAHTPRGDEGGRGTLAAMEVTRACTFSSSLRLGTGLLRRATSVRLSATLAGNALLASAAAKPRTVRVR